MYLKIKEPLEQLEEIKQIEAQKDDKMLDVLVYWQWCFCKNVKSLSPVSLQWVGHLKRFLQILTDSDVYILMNLFHSYSNLALAVILIIHMLVS